MADVIWLWVGIFGGTVGLIGAVQMWRRGRKTWAAAFGAFFLLALLDITVEVWALGKIADRAITMAMVVTGFAILIVSGNEVNARGRSSLR